MDIAPATMRAVYTALSTAFNTRLEATETFYRTVSMEVTSTTSQNEYPRMDDLPGIREWIGDRVVHDLSAQTYLIRNREFEGTIGIRRSQIEDDQLGFFTKIAEQMGQDAAEFPDQLVFPLLKIGESQLCYDGQNFFDTDHPGYNENGGETSVSNFTPGANPAWYLIDDTKVIQPIVFQSRKKFRLVRKDAETDDNVFNKGQFLYGVDGRCNAGYGLWQLIYKSKAELTPANFEAALTAMTTIRKRNGQVISIKPTKLLVPSTLRSAALKITNADLIDGGITNVNKGAAETVVIPLLG